MADNLGIQLFLLLMSDNEMQSIGHKATFVHIQAKLGQEDGEMSEMTLLSRQRIRNSNPGGLRQSIGHKATFVHIQAKLGQEDGEMSEMTLLSRQRIRNSNPGGLRPSPLRLGHGGSPQY